MGTRYRADRRDRSQRQPTGSRNGYTGGGRGAVAWVATFSLLVGAASAALPARIGDTPPAAVRDVLQEEPLTSYRAFRRMHAKNEKFDQEAWLDVWTEMNGREFTYQIVSERGSGYIRNKILREVLKREQEVVATGDAARADLSPTNYEFSEPDAHGPGVRYVLIKPKRKDVLLVDGRMVLSQDGRELLRVEGQLSKNPSFWTSLVNVIREYARLDGVRVPISIETIAKVKFAGKSYLDVEYEYETINGRPVSLAARQTLAAAMGR